MKQNMKQKFLKFVSKVVLNTAKKEANSACIFIGYQPKAPENLKKSRNF